MCYHARMKRFTNNDIAGELHSLAELAGKTSHKWIAYNAAAAAIKASDIDVYRAATDSSVPRPTIHRVGDKIWTIITQFCNTGGHTDIRRQLQAAADARKIFTKIIGVGDATADAWVNNGIYSLDQLRIEVAAKRIALSHTQALGLKYYDDLNMRIPRKEVEHVVRDLTPSIIAATQPIKGPVIVGSWRRGSQDSGDIDLLIACKDINGRVKALERTIDRALHLYSGTTRLSFLHRSWVYMRQVDVLVAPVDEYGAALLYFTGDWEFNESMRRYAKKHKMRLNQTGLYTKDSTRIAGETEESIFAALGLEFIEPSKRIGSVYD